MIHGPRPTALLVPVLLALSAVPGAQLPDQKLTDAQPSLLDQFGLAVAASGNRVIVGVPGADLPVPGGGGARVYARTPAGWVAEPFTQPASLTPDVHAGAAVALDADLAALGAPVDDLAGTDAGAVYLYRRGPAGWFLEEVVRAGPPVPGQRFGASVALSEGRLVAGAPREDAGGASAGAAYVFETGPFGWTQTARLDGAAAGDQLGFDVDFSGGTIVLGAPFANGSAGAVHVFEETPAGWVPGAVLDGGGTGAARFGYCLLYTSPSPRDQRGSRMPSSA